MIGDLDKLKCLARELALRRNVYAKRVRGGTMSEHEALHEITVIQAIVNDYKAKLEGNEEREKEKDNGN